MEIRGSRGDGRCGMKMGISGDEASRAAVLI